MKQALIAATFALSTCLAGCLSFHPGKPPGTPKLGEFAQVGGETIRFVDTGNPERDTSAANKTSKGNVVLVHGFGATIEEWLGVIPALKNDGYRVLALDLLGHGWSGRPPGDYSIPAQANRVLALASQRGMDEFAIVGHSWGSAVTMATAIAAPKRIKRIALYNGMYYEDQKPLIFDWAKTPGLGELIYGVFYPDRQDEKLSFAFYDPEKHVTEKMVEDVERVLSWPGTLAASLATIRAMRYAELQKRYPTVQQPVLLMWGREDNVTPLTYGERLLQQLPDARLVVYPRCGHLPMVEVPGPTNHQLLRFLAEGNAS